MKETELNKVLNYMKQYVENIYEHDSEPMLNWKDLKIILDYITNLQYKYENQIHRYKNLKDYATNLQEKNKELLEKFSNKIEEVSNLIKENEKLKLSKDTKCASEILCECLHNEYKSRCEKAIEYVEHHKFNKFGDIDCGEAEEIIKILNGGDENEQL